MKKVLQIGDPILEKKSGKVKNAKSESTQKIISELVAVCKKDAEKTAGLAAPQIGYNERIFVVRRMDIEEKYKKRSKSIPDEVKARLWEVMINPRIVKVGKKKSIFWEGCLSVKDVFGPVQRPSFVKVEFLDRYGKKRQLAAYDFFAHLVQHEYDHLEGVLFVKHVKNPKNLWKDKDLDDYIKKNGDFPELD